MAGEVVSFLRGGFQNYASAARSSEELIIYLLQPYNIKDKLNEKPLIPSAKANVKKDLQ
ncbi:TPA: hypothetical protein ACGCAO_004153 [Enterobacter cloacae]